MSDNQYVQMEVTQQEIGKIVAAVLAQMGRSSSLGNAGTGSGKDWDSVQYHGRRLIGIFEDMNEIFDMMDEDKKVAYDKTYIEELYLKYQEKDRVREELCWRILSIRDKGWI